MTNRTPTAQTARADLESRLRHADRMATIGRLAAAYVHDIGTPLSVIAGRASIIAESASDLDRARDSARRIAEQANRIARSLGRLLDFARTTSIEPRRASVLAIVREAVELTEALAGRSRIEVSATEGDAQFEALVDAGQIQQVLVNLIANALQAMETAPGLVQVRLSHAGGWATIDVSDTGPGVPEVDRERVFEPFYTTRDEGRGTGLGLTVCRNIVERHGGTIDLIPPTERGACFRVRLPLGEGR